MGMDLSAKVFYGFELVPDHSADESLRERVYEGDFDDWAGNKTNSPCATETIGWGDTTRVLGIRGTFVEAKSGQLKAFALKEVDPAWDEQLRAWCAEHGFKAGTPSWQVGAEYI